MSESKTLAIPVLKAAPGTIELDIERDDSGRLFMVEKSTRREVAHQSRVTEETDWSDSWGLTTARFSVLLVSGTEIHSGARATPRINLWKAADPNRPDGLFVLRDSGIVIRILGADVYTFTGILMCSMEEFCHGLGMGPAVIGPLPATARMIDSVLNENEAQAS